MDVIQWNTTTKKASRKRIQSGDASKFNGRPNGRITGMDMRHLLLLLPFLLFDLLQDEVDEYNSKNYADLQSPVSDLTNWVLVLLEWCRLYRYDMTTLCKYSLKCNNAH